MLKQLYNPLSNKFDLVNEQDVQFSGIAVTDDMSTAEFKAKGTNIQWIVEAFSVADGVYTPVIITYIKTVEDEFTILSFSWNTSFEGVILIKYWQEYPKVELPEQYYKNFYGPELVFPKNGGIDFSIYAILPSNSFSMFEGSSIENFPSGNIITTNVVSLEKAFKQCQFLREITIDLSSCQNLIDTFSYCVQLKKITLLNTNKVAYINRTFSYCISLKEVIIHTKSNYYLTEGFIFCMELEKVSLITDIGTRIYEPTQFQQCGQLKECKINRIGDDISFSDSPLLSLESIQFMIQNSYSANHPTNIRAFTMTLHPDTLAKVQADTTVYEWNGQSYTGLITLATAMQITIQ